MEWCICEDGGLRGRGVGIEDGAEYAVLRRWGLVGGWRVAIGPLILRNGLRGLSNGGTCHVCAYLRDSHQSDLYVSTRLSFSFGKSNTVFLEVYLPRT